MVFSALTAIFTGITAFCLVYDRLRGLTVYERIEYKLSMMDLEKHRRISTSFGKELITLFSGSITIMNNSTVARSLNGWKPSTSVEAKDVVFLLEGLPRIIQPRSGISVRYTACIWADVVRPDVYKGVLFITYDGKRQLKIPYKVEITGC